MRKLLAPICLFATMLLMISCQTREATTKVQPNLLIIMVDDMGWADVGFNGCKDIPTPNIDKIADQGVRFEQGYVTFPVCGPSRAGFLTGRYQDRFGFTTNPSIDPKNPIAGLPVEEQTLAQVLKPAGYTSAVVGKWHMGTHPVFHPLERGFDYFYGFLSGGHRYFPEELELEDLSAVRRKWQWYRTKLIENRETVEATEYLTDAFSHVAVEFIQQQAATEQPFMLYLAYNAPHTPMQATEKYLSRFPDIADPKRKTYAAMVSAVDDGVGEILETLEQTGIMDNTLIVFLSDNGGATNNASDNGPFRGRKGDLFEGGLRVPFAMRWDGVLPAGKNYTQPISSMDVMATIVEVNDIAIDEQRALDGVNLIPFLRGEKQGAPHDYLFWRKWEQNALAVRHGDLKLLKHTQKDIDPAQLYDVGKGDEHTDLKAHHPASYDSLMNKWELWNSQLKDRVFPTLSTDVWWEQVED